MPSRVDRLLAGGPICWHDQHETSGLVNRFRPHTTRRNLGSLGLPVEHHLDWNIFRTRLSILLRDDPSWGGSFVLCKSAERHRRILGYRVTSKLSLLYACAIRTNSAATPVFQCWECTTRKAKDPFDKPIYSPKRQHPSEYISQRSRRFHRWCIASSHAVCACGGRCFSADIAEHRGWCRARALSLCLRRDTRCDACRRRRCLRRKTINCGGDCSAWQEVNRTFVV